MNGKNPDTRTAGRGILPLLLLMITFLPAGAGYGAEFILLYANDNRGEIEPCG